MSFDYTILYCEKPYGSKYFSMIYLHYYYNK